MGVHYCLFAVVLVMGFLGGDMNIKKRIWSVRGLVWFLGLISMFAAMILSYYDSILWLLGFGLGMVSIVFLYYTRSKG
jgi:hypothetical protein